MISPVMGSIISAVSVIALPFGQATPFPPFFLQSPSSSTKRSPRRFSAVVFGMITNIACVACRRVGQRLVFFADYTEQMAAWEVGVMRFPCCVRLLVPWMARG